ncbi:MAG: DUF4177 domain-containing protein [Balneolaceae bacterium]|nr:DUF4177 domain-containing protein [Balneolaceae bacterium]
MRQYKVVPFSTGCISGNLDPQKLEQTINQFSSQGWKFERSIHETKTVAIIFRREAHFLIFSKES